MTEDTGSCPSRKQSAVRHLTISRLAHMLWHLRGRNHGGDVQDWLDAEGFVESCPHCRRRTMAGLPWFAEDALTVCPACCRVVMFLGRIPLVPDKQTEERAKSDGTLTAMRRAWGRDVGGEGHERLPS